MAGHGAWKEGTTGAMLRCIQGQQQIKELKALMRRPNTQRDNRKRDCKSNCIVDGFTSEYIFYNRDTTSGGAIDHGAAVGAGEATQTGTVSEPCGHAGARTRSLFGEESVVRRFACCSKRTSPYPSERICSSKGPQKATRGGTRCRSLSLPPDRGRTGVRQWIPKAFSGPFRPWQNIGGGGSAWMRSRRVVSRRFWALDNHGQSIGCEFKWIDDVKT